jgi:hypothetical protein
VTLGAGSRRSYPLKTSRRCNQLWCVSPCSLRVVVHVALIRLVKDLLRLILVAVILSVVSLSLITLFHLVLTSWSVCCLSFLCMTLSHLITQMRWLASDIRIRKSLVLPFVLIVLALFSPSGCLPCSWRSILPMPSMVPSLTSGHLCHSCGHSSLARFHISSRAFALHSSKMCVIDSSVLQILHIALVS